MLDDQEFRSLLDRFDRPWAGYRKVRRGVKKRIDRHMEGLGCGTFAEYLSLIEQHPPLRQACRQLLAVTISRFLRDRNMWHCLAERILPLLGQRFPNGLKAWSAGCANGEEAYSLALIWQLMADKHQLPPISILATDVQPDCLRRAQEGEYPRSSLKELTPEVRERFFMPLPGGRFTVTPVLRAPLQWRVHDLTEAPPANDFHLILLRNNLLTYYQGDLLRHAFWRISIALAAGGWIALGSREHPPAGRACGLHRDPECPWLYEKRA